VRHEHLPDGRILAEAASGSWWYDPETGVVEIASLAVATADEYLDATGLPDRSHSCGPSPRLCGA